MSLNLVVLTGNITNDPEIKSSASGLLVAKITIAWNEVYKGEKKAHFFDAVAFGKTAELLRDYFKKGSALTVEGVLKQDRWETKEGDKRSKLTVSVNKIHFQGSKGGGSTGNEMPNNTRNTKEDEPDTFYDADHLNSDIPF
jgi:single-strand DNA-binding protein